MQDWEQEEKEPERQESSAPLMDKEDRRMYLFGAMGASLFIALIYIAAFGLLILFLQLVWGVL